MPITANPPLTVLLDLNYTLVGNSQSKMRPFTKQIAQEEYRPWLIATIKLLQRSGARILLVTARPQMHEERTLSHLWETTGFRPDASYFNTGGPPSVWKGRVVKRLLEDRTLQLGTTPFAQLVAQGCVVAYESNPRSRQMYASHGIPSMRVCETKNGEVD